MHKKYLILIAALLLTACGFHLRGSQTAMSVNIDSLYLQSTGAAGVTDEVRDQLQQTGTRITDNAGEAEYTLRLAGQRMERSVLSVSATTGKVEEYKLALSVLMSVSKNGKSLVSNETIQASRDYTIDDDAVLGKFSEEELLQREMIQRAAAQIIRRLGALARK